MGDQVRTLSVGLLHDCSMSQSRLKYGLSISPHGDTRQVAVSGIKAHLPKVSQRFGRVELLERTVTLHSHDCGVARPPQQNIGPGGGVNAIAVT